MNALYMAGGITDKGTLRAIRVFRNNQQLSEIDLYSYLMDGNLDGDVRLEDGDVIVVNTYNALTSIDGKVKRPMHYEMKQDETLLILAPMMVLLLSEESIAAGFSFIALTFVLCIILVILANTWAKKNPLK